MPRLQVHLATRDSHPPLQKTQGWGSLGQGDAKGWASPHAMKLRFVDNMDQVLAVALEGPLPQMPSEAETMAPITPPPAGETPTARQ
jgi:hypothetical protein